MIFVTFGKLETFEAIKITFSTLYLRNLSMHLIIIEKLSILHRKKFRVIME